MMRCFNRTRLLCLTQQVVLAQEMQAYGRSQGFPVVLNPAAMSQDDSPLMPVMQRAVRQIAAESSQPYARPQLCCAGAHAKCACVRVCRLGSVCLLRATSPCRTAEDIRRAYALFDAFCSDKPPRADSVVSVQAVTAAHPSRFKRIVDAGSVAAAAPAAPWLADQSTASGDAVGGSRSQRALPFPGFLADAFDAFPEVSHVLCISTSARFP